MTDEQYLLQLLFSGDGENAFDEFSSRKAQSVPSLTVTEETYLRIWEIEQGITSNRWTVSTFFISISFAIFGFSFQAQLIKPLPEIARVSSLIIYWFAYLLFVRFHEYTSFLRKYLRELEVSKKIEFDIQTRFHKEINSGYKKYIQVKFLLVYLGIIYSIGVLILSIVGL